MTITIRPTVSSPALGRLARSTRSNPALAAAVAASAPEYISITEQLARLTRTAPQVLPTRTDDDLAADITARLAAGEGVPSDLLTTVAAVSDYATAWTRASTMLNRIAESLSEQRDNLLQNRSDAIVRHLAGQLKALFDELPLEVRTAPDTAEAAIAARNVDRYEAAQTAAATYATIRDAQSQIARAIWHIDTGDFTWWPIAGFIAAPDDAWPDLVAWRTTGRARNQHGNMLPVSPPWPSLHTAEAFTWLLAHPEAKPWIPSAKEYADATARLDALVRPTPTGRKTTTSGRRAPSLMGYPDGYVASTI